MILLHFQKNSISIHTRLLSNAQKDILDRKGYVIYRNCEIILKRLCLRFRDVASVGLRHRAWETTWVATIALSRATRFWWRDTHCTTAVWRWLITVADRTHTRVSRSMYTDARVRASTVDNESLVVVQIWIFDGGKPRGVRYHLEALVLTDREIKAQRPSGPSNGERRINED